MRTTISLDESLLRAAKQAALSRGTTLNQVIADALQAALLRPAHNPRPAFDVLTYGGDGLQPGVTLDNPGAYLDEEDVQMYLPRTSRP